nr:long-chain-fatty-acid--CoA ligase [Rhodococcus sp. HNM0569]
MLALEGVTERGVHFEDSFVSWADHVRASHARAAALESFFEPGRPRHIGLLMDNIPEFSFVAGAAALSGGVVVGLNTTRRGAALERDIALADCAVVLTDSANASLLEGFSQVPVLDVESESWRDLVAHAPAEHGPADTDGSALFMLIFTSGTSGDPKAVRCTHDKITGPGEMLATRFGIGAGDVVYCAMPMFHSNAMMASWSVALSGGASIALRRKFSASGFLPDVRRYGVTFSNYVGKIVSYILATPELPDDADNTLRIMYGNEGSATAVTEFARRYGCRVVDGFGSTEGGISISAHPDSPAGALGKLPDGVAILDLETGQPCPPARFDASGRILNADEATGELVNVTGTGGFAGYYGNPEADAERIRDGRYHSGDLAYLDADGFVYFAGRTSGWLRVDGENLAVAPIERVLSRFPGFGQVAVYPVPDPDVGDRVMAAAVCTREFDPTEFEEFLSAQADLGPKQVPTFVRLCRELPRTATFKVLTRTLSAEACNTPDPVWEFDRTSRRFSLLDSVRATSA